MAWIFNKALIILEVISRQCACAKGWSHILVNQFLLTLAIRLMFIFWHENQLSSAHYVLLMGHCFPEPYFKLSHTFARVKKEEHVSPGCILQEKYASQ